MQAASARPAVALAHPLSGAIARLEEDETFHDVVFVVGEERIGAVRAVVASRSDHWERAFYGQCRESTEREVVVGETDPQSFRHLLHFIRTDQLHTSFDLPNKNEAKDDKAKHDVWPYDQSFALWELAERYNVPDLKILLVITQPVRLLEFVDHHKAGMQDEMCEKLLGDFESSFTRNIDLQCLLETFEKVLQLSSAMAGQSESPLGKRVVESARAACIRCIKDKGNDLVTALIKGEKRQQWIKSSAELVEAVLSCQILKIIEIKVFAALAAWWNHDRDGRTEQSQAMVPRVLRLPLLSYAQLAGQVEPRGLLSMEQLKNAYKSLARYMVVVFNNLVLDSGTSNPRYAKTLGDDAKWRFTLCLTNGHIRITHKCNGFHFDITASVFVGRDLRCKEVKLDRLNSDIGLSLDLSAYIGSTTTVTIVFCCP